MFKITSKHSFKNIDAIFKKNAMQSKKRKVN